MRVGMPGAPGNFIAPVPLPRSSKCTFTATATPGVCQRAGRQSHIRDCGCGRRLWVAGSGSDPTRRSMSEVGAVEPSEVDLTLAARRRASVAAVAAGWGLLLWFQVVRQVVRLDPSPPMPEDPDERFIEFYVGNASRLAWIATAYALQWALMLVLLAAVVRAVCRRFDLAAILALLLAGAATAVYVVGEGVKVWPVVQGDVTEETVRRVLEPGVARALLESRDGLHAPAAVLLGISVLLIGWLLLRSGLRGRWVMAGLSAVSGGLALSSVVVGPDGFGPGLIFVLWGPVVPVLVLFGLRRLQS